MYLDRDEAAGGGLSTPFRSNTTGGWEELDLGGGGRASRIKSVQCQEKPKRGAIKTYDCNMLTSHPSEADGGGRAGIK